MALGFAGYVHRNAVFALENCGPLQIADEEVKIGQICSFAVQYHGVARGDDVAMIARCNVRPAWFARGRELFTVSTVYSKDDEKR